MIYKNYTEPMQREDRYEIRMGWETTIHCHKSRYVINSRPQGRCGRSQNPVIQVVTIYVTHCAVSSNYPVDKTPLNREISSRVLLSQFKLQSSLPLTKPQALLWNVPCSWHARASVAAAHFTLV
jgi:hypothetical protein